MKSAGQQATNDGRRFKVRAHGLSGWLRGRGRWRGVLLAAAMGLALPGAHADSTIAYYRFEPGPNFLKDSSGNGYDLTGTAAQSNDVANVSGGTGSAYFNGTTHGLKTATAINYAGVSRLRISFAMRAADSTVRAIVENSENFSSHSGAYLLDVNESGAGLGNFGYKTSGGWNIDKVPHSINNTGWDLIQVEIVPVTNAYEIVRVWTNGVLLPNTTVSSYSNAASTMFYNGILNVGSRNQSSIFFKGNIDELKIESIEPVGDAVSNYWNTTSAAAQSFNNILNWSQFYQPRPVDTAVFTNWGNYFTLNWDAPVTNKDAVIDAIGQTLEIRPGPINWTITNSLRIGNSVSGKSSFSIYGAGTLAVTNSSGTAALYVNWGTPGLGQLNAWGASALTIVADHLYTTNVFGSVGLDSINDGTLTTRGESIFAGTAQFYVGRFGKDVTWNILGGTNTVKGDFRIGAQGLNGGNGTGTVNVIGPTAVLWANAGAYCGGYSSGTGTGGIGRLVIRDGGRAVITNNSVYLGSQYTGTNSVLVTGTGSVWETEYQVYLYSYFENNTIRIENGGRWKHNKPNNIYWIGAGTATNNAVIVDGPGSLLHGWGTLELGGGAGVQNGRGLLVVQNGGAVTNADYGWISIGNGTADSYGEVRVVGEGSVLAHPSGPTVVGRGAYYPGVGYRGNGTGLLYVANGGLLECGSTWIGTNATASMKCDGGILQYLAANPDITTVTPGLFVVTNSTISFRNVSGVNIFGNVSGTTLTNATFQGRNAFRLNGSTNAASGQDYVFDTGRGATNYVRLELLNGSTYRGGAVTIGGGGSMLVSNGPVTIASSLTLQAGATVTMHVTTNAGSGLAVGGVAALGGATLQVTLGSPPVEGQWYPLLSNPGTAPVAGLGTFASSTLTAAYGSNTYSLAVRYGVIDGNDVALMLATKGCVFTLR